jgi:hypothetical protein
MPPKGARHGRRRLSLRAESRPFIASCLWRSGQAGKKRGTRHGLPGWPGSRSQDGRSSAPRSRCQEIRSAMAAQQHRPARSSDMNSAIKAERVAGRPSEVRRAATQLVRGRTTVPDFRPPASHGPTSAQGVSRRGPRDLACAACVHRWLSGGLRDAHIEEAVEPDPTFAAKFWIGCALRFGRGEAVQQLLAVAIFGWFL